MVPDPSKLLEIAQIENLLVGFYDTPEKDSFAPFTEAGHCIFSGYQGWMKGESSCLSEQTAGNYGCPGAGYWNCNLSTVPQEMVAHYLAVDEGLKKSPGLNTATPQPQPLL